MRPGRSAGRARRGTGRVRGPRSPARRGRRTPRPRRPCRPGRRRTSESGSPSRNSTSPGGSARRSPCPASMLDLVVAQPWVRAESVSRPGFPASPFMCPALSYIASRRRSTSASPRRAGRTGRWDARVRGVRAGVPVRRGVAAADVAAGQAQPQMHPRRADLQALLATLGGAGRDWPDRGYVGTGERARPLGAVRSSAAQPVHPVAIRPPRAGHQPSLSARRTRDLPGAKASPVPAPPARTRPPRVRPRGCGYRVISSRSTSGIPTSTGNPSA